MKLGSDILWLSEQDVKSLLTMKDVIGAVEQAFRLHGEKKTQLPNKIYLTFDPFGGDLRAMPAYINDTPAKAGVKIVNSNPNNPAKGLPAVSGVMVIVDPETGLVQALCAAGHLTAIRTGAAGGLAVKVLAREKASTVGLVGCGRQALTQLEALIETRSIKKVFVWGALENEAKQFCEKNAGVFSGSLIPRETIQEVCKADIIVTTTPVTRPIIKAEWVQPGAHINAIGADAPGKQELEVDLIKKARVFVDEWGQASHAGEINNAVTAGEFSRYDCAAGLGDVVAGQKKGRQSDSEITIFDSTGLAIQDVAVASLLLEKAQKNNKGQVLKFNG